MPASHSAGTSLTRRQAIVVLTIASFMFATGAALTVRSLVTTHARPGPARAQAPYAVGQQITQGAVAISVDAVDWRAGSAPFIAPDGTQYAVVGITATNRTETPIQVLPPSDVYVKAADGTIVYLTPDMVENPFRAGELPPGETIKGQLSYLVKNDTAYNLYIDAGWSGGVLPFRLR